MKSIIILCLCIFLVLQNTQISYAQIENNFALNSSSFLLNPSFAGLNKVGKVTIQYNELLPGLKENLEKYAVSYETFFSKIKSGIGLYYFRYSQVAFRTNDFGLIYNFHITLFKNLTFVPGLKINFLSTNLDFRKLRFGDQLSFDYYDISQTIEAPPLAKTGMIDLSSSMILYNQDFWFGINFAHLLQPNASHTGDYNSQKLLTIFHAGYNFSLDQKKETNQNNIVLSILFQNQQKYNSFDLRMYYSHGIISNGIAFRKENSISSKTLINNISYILGLSYEKLNVGFSFQLINMETNKNYSTGMELLLAYKFNRNNKKSK